MSAANYQADSQWVRHYRSEGPAFPAEYVVRIFRGNYPNLAMPRPQPTQSVLDLGCGNGRHLAFFAGLGLEAYGVEIALPIVAQVREALAPAGIPAYNLKVGTCATIPFPDASFDYLLAWNSAYYMSLDGATFGDHVSEMARVVRPGGWLVISVPKSSAFIFAGSEPSALEGYRIVRQDPFGQRNGEVMRVFGDADELEAAFSGSFDSFCHGNIHDDCFGYAYHWFLMAARRRGPA